MATATANNWHPITNEEAAPIFAKVPTGHIDNATALEAAFFIHAHHHITPGFPTYRITEKRAGRADEETTWRGVGGADAAVSHICFGTMMGWGADRYTVTVA